MQLIEETYFRTPLTHAVDCSPVPAWEADVVETPGTRVQLTGQESHRCITDGCGHEREFSRLQVRIRCTGCGIVHVIEGEALTRYCTTTAETGWGQPPQQHAGLWLWPGRPTIPGGQPHQYLVTRTEDPPTRETLHGIVSAHDDSTWRTQRWTAGAHPDPASDRQVSLTPVRHLSTGHETLDAAVAWIASLDQAAQQPALVVAV
ncbi:hypothetical protein ACIPEL_36140 [Streptomyces griseoviridis]